VNSAFRHAPVLAPDHVTWHLGRLGSLTVLICNDELTFRQRDADDRPVADVAGQQSGGGLL
jgi:hypothetical protein